MKKQYAVTILGVLLTTTGFTYRSVGGQAPAATSNFEYTAYPSDDPVDLNNPENYMLTANGGTEVPICSGVAHRCAVVAEDDGTGHPDFTRPYTIRTRS